MLLSTGITKLTSITQNNHVYEYTAEGPTPEISLNVRNPYRRQKRDFSIIRSSFRRFYRNWNTCDYTDYLTFFPTTSTTLLLFCDWLLPTSYFTIFLRLTTFYFLPSYLLATISTTFYLSRDYTDYFLSFYLLAIDYFLPFYFSPDRIDYFLLYFRLLPSVRAPGGMARKDPGSF